MFLTFKGLLLIKAGKYLAITLSSDSSETRMKYASRYFFLILNYHENYLSIASVLFVNLHENSAIYFSNYCKSVYFDNPLGSSGVY